MQYNNMKAKVVKFVIIQFLFVFALFAANEENKSGYVIDQPGTITFTSGVKIKGKVEKPQVVIFMTKEKSASRAMDFDYSFKEDIMESIELNPLIEDLTKNEK